MLITKHCLAGIWGGESMLLRIVKESSLRRQNSLKGEACSCKREHLVSRLSSWSMLGVLEDQKETSGKKREKIRCRVSRGEVRGHRGQMTVIPASHCRNLTCILNKKWRSLGDLELPQLFLDSSSNLITPAAQLRANYSGARRRVGKPVRWLLQLSDKWWWLKTGWKQWRWWEIGFWMYFENGEKRTCWQTGCVWDMRARKELTLTPRCWVITTEKDGICHPLSMETWR